MAYWISINSERRKLLMVKIVKRSFLVGVRKFYVFWTRYFLTQFFVFCYKNVLNRNRKFYGVFLISYVYIYTKSCWHVTALFYNPVWFNSIKNCHMLTPSLYLIGFFLKKPLFTTHLRKSCSIVSFTSFTCFNNRLPFTMFPHIINIFYCNINK